MVKGVRGFFWREKKNYVRGLSWGEGAAAMGAPGGAESGKSPHRPRALRADCRAQADSPDPHSPLWPLLPPPRHCTSWHSPLSPRAFF